MAERTRLWLACAGLALLLAGPGPGQGQERDKPTEEAGSLGEAELRRAREGRQRPPIVEREPEHPGILAPETPAPEPGLPPVPVPTRASGSDPDSLLEALRRLEGYTVTTYSGSGAEFGADSGAVVLAGPAELERAGQKIAADSMLTFNRESGVVCGYGSPVLSGEGTPINSDQMCYDTERRMGMALGASTEFTQNGTWFVHGERVFTIGSDAIYSSNTEFTTCDLEVPHYHFTASQFKMVHNRILVARDVTLNFGGVPVFWLPFLVQSLREGRRSGLLTPSFGVSDIVQTGSGNTRQVSNLGVFWAINDYMGSELALDWRSNDWVALRGRFDYRWTRQFLQGYVNARQFYRDSGSRELTLSADNSWQPGERTQVRVSGQYASSNDFIQRETYDPQELNRTLESNGAVSHRFERGGSVTLGASRLQEIMSDRVTTTLPSLNLSLPALTLLSVDIDDVPTEMVWTASTSYSATDDDRDDLGSLALTDRDSRNQSARLGSSIRFGNLNFSQSVNAQDQVLEAKPAVIGETQSGIDTTDALPGAPTRGLDWTASLSYRQDLIGTMRVTPQLSVNGRVLESPLTDNQPLTAPVSLNFGAELAADVFGFWPGVGPFERFRHRMSPSISYGFRPEPNQTLQQDSVFGATTRATNAIQLSFAQTFEGKRPAETAADSAGDTASDDRATDTGEPRRIQGTQPIRLLSITTSAIAYDFEAASRGDEGLTTTSINNSIASDLLRGLTLTFSHELFDPLPPGTPTGGDRHFDLHLAQVNTSFGLSGDSWLFRWLGVGGEGEAESPAEAGIDTTDMETLMPQSDEGLVPGAMSSRGARGMGRVGSTGTWRANLSYSLQRPRDQTLDENQSLSGDVAFQPTENWSVGWNSNYSLTDSEFQNNSVTLTRALHRWQADFRILRAQNGNFSFEFEARLSDLPELRVPYDQRSRGDAD